MNDTEKSSEWRLVQQRRKRCSKNFTDFLMLFILKVGVLIQNYSHCWANEVILPTFHYVCNGGSSIITQLVLLICWTVVLIRLCTEFSCGSWTLTS